MKLLASFLLIAAAFAAEPAGSAVSKVFDQQVTMIEREFVPLAEAMPADKYGFVPPGPEFQKSRTFGQQVSHVASVMHACAAKMMEEKPPAELGENENGPAALKTKDDIVKYLKDSFAYAHKATAMLTSQNMMDMVPSPFGNDKVPRVSLATIPVWHSFDHYGQMVIYARMNGIVPPASR